MIFSDLRFLAIFILCWITFAAVAPRWRTAVLAIFGALFYGLYAGQFLGVVLVLTALVFAVKWSSVMGWIAALATIAVLVYWKIAVVATPPPPPTTGLTGVLVPIGLSYLSFELIHVAIEYRRGRIKELTVPDLLAFVFFMPARIAGPIKRYPAFIEAVRNAERSAANVYAGFLRILFGFTKKFLFADLLALTVMEKVYADTPRQMWTVVFAFSLQLFFDFSAYSDIAIGLARMMGIALPENFNWPYLASNIREFWDRWHITLSQWVRDYVFTPVGRTLFRTKLRPWPIAIAAISYLVTFAVVGAWHGLTTAYLVWGLYHGVLLTLYHIFRLKIPQRINEHPWYRSRAARLIAIGITFLFVTVGWVPFMAPIDEAAKMLAVMFGGHR